MEIRSAQRHTQVLHLRSMGLMGACRSSSWGRWTHRSIHTPTFGKVLPQVQSCLLQIGKFWVLGYEEYSSCLDQDQMSQTSSVATYSQTLFGSVCDPGVPCPPN